MRIRLLVVLAVLALGIGVASNATADTFTFNADFCTNPCLGGTASSNNGGTVVVTQAGTNIVDVKVTLNSLFFHDQGLESFVWNITGNPTLTLVTGTLANGDIKIIDAGGSSWTFAQPAGNTDGAGKTFGYSLDCSSGSGACTGSPSTLEFQIDLTGLTPTSLETTAGSGGTTTLVDFAANVANGTCTGMIGAGNGTGQSTPVTTGTGGTACGGTAVPEPATLALLGSGLVSLGLASRRKWMGHKAA